MQQVLITVDKDLFLKSWGVKNSSELFRLTDQNRKHLQRWLPWVPGVKTEEDSIKFISRTIKELRKGNGLRLGIWFLNKLVGCIGLHELSKSNRGANLGYWLSKDYQGKGIMTKSVKSLVDYSFNILNLNRIGLQASTENLSSCAVAERLGFVKEGIA